MKNTSSVFKVLGGIFILFGFLAIAGSVMLWGQGFYFNFPKNIDLAIPTADIFVNGPASILTGIGLWRVRKWGYSLAWFTAGVYLYASVEIFVWAFQEANLTPEIVVPQAMAVVVALVVLFVSWNKRDEFV